MIAYFLTRIAILSLLCQRLAPVFYYHVLANVSHGSLAEFLVNIALQFPVFKVVLLNVDGATVVEQSGLRVSPTHDKECVVITDRRAIAASCIKWEQFKITLKIVQT